MKRPEKELDMIRGKMLAGVATQEELNEFLIYVTALEGFLDDCDLDDMFGTEGWRRQVGLE